METRFAKKRREQPFTEKQLDLVIGSLLGDGHLIETTSGYAFRVNHGLDQKDYVWWKYHQLKEFVRSVPKQSGNCFFFRTISHPVFNKLYVHFLSKWTKAIANKNNYKTIKCFYFGNLVYG